MFMDEIEHCKKAINAYLDQSDAFVLSVMTLSALLTSIDTLLDRYILKENESSLANVTYILALTTELAKLITKTEKICLELADDLQHTTTLTPAAQQKLKTILAHAERCLNQIFTLIHMDEKHVDFTAPLTQTSTNIQHALQRRKTCS